MKKLGFILILGIVSAVLAYLWQSHRGYTSSQIDDVHIYVFEQATCPHCHHAKQYISATYPNITVVYRNIAQKQNMQGLVACADKFHLDKQKLGTPLICMGQHVILGWGDKQQKQFDQYVQPFIQK